MNKGKKNHDASNERGKEVKKYNQWKTRTDQNAEKKELDGQQTNNATNSSQNR